MPTQYIFDLKDDKVPPSIGNKARNLQFLRKNGFPTPPAHVCTWDAYLRYTADEPEIVEILNSELAELADLSEPHAVRSSANLEDGLDSSFAGQFKTVLNVRDVNQILQSIWSIWASAYTPGTKAYLEKKGLGPDALKMAVVIQRMVRSVVSGVSFSKNPMTGLDETIVEAVLGSGEALVQEGVTPNRWIHKWGDWILEPEAEEIDADLIAEVVQQTKAIAKSYGKPVDLEWVFDGTAIHWVQLREITAMDINVYSNHISKEVFPGIIKPLIWSVNVPLVNGAWTRLFTELIGPNDIEPTSLARAFYHRAYFNMGAIGQIFELMGMPRETLELLMGIESGGSERPRFKPSRKTYRLMPRMLGAAIGKLRFSRKLDAFIPPTKDRYDEFHSAAIDRLTEQQLLVEIDKLFTLAQETAYYNIVTPVLMQIYSKVLASQLESTGLDFEQVDLTGGMQELDEFVPNAHLSELHHKFSLLDDNLRTRISDGSYDKFSEIPGLDALQHDVDHFLTQFGHLSDSGNDFSAVPWREDPDLILRLIVNYSPPDDRGAVRLSYDDLELSGLRKRALHPIYQRARRYRLYREAVSLLYTFGYGLFRDYFLGLGDRFVDRGIITYREDIFFLHHDEVKGCVRDHTSESSIRETIARRKRELDACRDIVPPGTIFGDETPPLERPTTRKMKGTPTSRGHYTGPVKVVHGIRDFDKVEDGDVLTIPYSDVGWTPLFAKAGAVIAESGGILSHSSIVAREYGIPAVVSVSDACRIVDSTIVTVDGYRGEVIIQDHD